MAIDTVPDLVSLLTLYPLLEAPQLAEVVQRMQPRFRDPRALAKELHQRGWLTAYHVNTLFQGRGTELVLGPYLLLDRIGEGGMGQVYKARHQKLNKIVALKLVRQEWLSQPEAVRRFHREIRAAAQLSHANIVMAFDGGQIGETHYIAMELVEGVDLGKMIKQHGALPAVQACDYIRQAALGLQHAHEKNMVHRDIKPSNLLVTKVTGGGSEAGFISRWGQVKILDMGLARIPRPTDSQADASGTLTHAGAVVGTPDYIAPEQARDSRTVDIRADIYSLGCTFYHLLTGQVLFPGGTGMEKLFKHQLDLPRPVEKLKPGLPKGLAAVVNKLLAKLPEERYQLPIEVARALEPFCQEASTAKANTGIKVATAPPVPTRQGDAPPEDDTVDLPKAIPVDARTEAKPAQRHRPTRSIQTDVTPTDPASYEASIGPRFTKLKSGRKRRWWLAPAIAAGMLICLIALGAILLPGGKKSPTTQQFAQNTPPNGSDRTGPGPSSSQVGRPKSVLESLHPSQIPASDRLKSLPAEVVAVLGDGRLRMGSVVGHVAMRPDGRAVAAVGYDKSIREWDTTTGELLHDLRGSSSQVFTMTYSADGKSVILLEPEGMREIELASVRNLRTLPPPYPESRFSALGLQGKVATLTTSDNVGPKFKVWDLVENKELFPLVGSTAASVPVIAPGGKILAVLNRGAGNMNNEVVIYDLLTGQVRNRWALGRESVFNFAMSPDGDTVAFFGASRNLQVWSTAKNQKLFARENLMVGMVMSFTPDGGTLLVANNDTLVSINSANGEDRGPPQKPCGTNQRISQLALSADSSVMAIGSLGPRLVIWDMKNQTERFPPKQGHRGVVSGLGFSDDGRTLVSASNYPEPSIRFWDLAQRTERGQISDMGNFQFGARITPDGRTLISRTAEGLNFYEIATGKEIPGLPQARRVGMALQSPAGGVLALVSPAEQSIIFYNFPSLQQRCAIKSTNVFGTNLMAFSADGGLIAIADHQGNIRIYETLTGQERTTAAISLGVACYGLALSGDGGSLAAMGIDGAVKLWDAPSGRERAALPNPTRGGGIVQFSADGKTLIIRQTKLRLMDAVTGKEKTLDRMPTEYTSALAVSPTQPIIASSDMEGNLIVTDLTTGQHLATYKLPGMIMSLAFAADGRHLATGNGNGTIYILRLPDFRSPRS